MAAHAGGFCVYNDVAIAIAWLLGQGAERIAYVDIDALAAGHLSSALQVSVAGGVVLAFTGGNRLLLFLFVAEAGDLRVPGIGCPRQPRQGPRYRKSKVRVVHITELLRMAES